MSLENFTETVRSKVGADANLKSTIKFAFKEGGALYIDGKSTPNRVSNEDAPADCTVKLSLEDFGKLIARQLDPMTAFMTGKLTIEGDMGVAMKLGKVFG
jgi:putative sterol carrier protein